MFFTISSCGGDNITALAGDDPLLRGRLSTPKISYDAEITTRVIPEEGTLQDMCKVDLLMIQRLPTIEHVEFLMDTTTTPCISVDRFSLTYESLREGKMGDNDYSPAGSFTICNGQFTQVYGDTTVTTTDGLDIEFWTQVYASHFATDAQIVSDAKEVYEQMLIAGDATIEDGYYKLAFSNPQGGSVVRYISVANLLPNSEIIYDGSGKWNEKYHYQYFCQADSTYIPFITHTWVRDTTVKCSTPYVKETITAYKNYQKINL